MTAVLVSLLLLAVPASSAAADGEAPAPSRVTSGAGSWKSGRQVLARATQAWSVTVTRGDDDSLHGRIAVADSIAIGSGNVHGRIAGTSVTGTITGDDGDFLGSFEGRLDGDEMKGTYTTADGDSGTWSWAEPAAKQVVAERESAAVGAQAFEDAAATEDEAAAVPSH